MENGVFVEEEHKGGEFRLGLWFGRARAIFMEEGAKYEGFRWGESKAEGKTWKMEEPLTQVLRLPSFNPFFFSF